MAILLEHKNSRISAPVWIEHMQYVSVLGIPVVKTAHWKVFLVQMLNMMIIAANVSPSACFYMASIVEGNDTAYSKVAFKFPLARFLNSIHSSNNTIDGTLSCSVVNGCFTSSYTGLNNIQFLFSHSPFRGKVVNICNLDFIFK
jgi:hypothetical protein